MDWDSVAGPQCVDVAKAYNELALGFPRITGNAIDWINRGGTHYDTIHNSPDPNLFPKPGDIIVWGKMPNNDLGHVAVCISANNTSFVSFYQNWCCPRTCRVVTHNYNYVIGWLHPKTMEGGEEMIDAGQVNVLYNLMLEREAEPAGLAGKVGRPWWAVFSEIFNSPERAALLVKKQTELSGLKDEVMGLKVKNSNQEMQLANLDAETVKLRVEVKNNTELLKSQESLINNQTKEIEELNKKVASRSTQGTNASSGSVQNLPAIQINPKDAPIVKFIKNFINWVLS